MVVFLFFPTPKLYSWGPPKLLGIPLPPLWTAWHRRRLPSCAWAIATPSRNSHSDADERLLPVRRVRVSLVFLASGGAFVCVCVDADAWCGVLHLMVLLSWLELHIRGLLDKLLFCALMMGRTFFFLQRRFCTRRATRRDRQCRDDPRQRDIRRNARTHALGGEGREWDGVPCSTPTSRTQRNI